MNMDGAESDHSMTWEDFFGSTTDLTPTLIGIYDSLLEPSIPNKPTNQANKQVSKHDKGANLIPQTGALHAALKTTEGVKQSGEDAHGKPNSKMEPTAKIPGGVKLPLSNTNKSSLYSRRTNIENKSDQEGAINNKNVNVLSNDNTTSFLYKVQGKAKMKEVGTFDNLSPNVKRMLTSADATTSNTLKQKKTNVRASIRGPKSNIPLVGATSKISQSGVDILDSVEIYDQPTLMKKNKSVEEAPVKIPLKTRLQSPVKLPQFRLESEINYDASTNPQDIYDVPNTKTAFESLSLPYIDQSLDLSPSSNDREFDTKIKKTPEVESTLFTPNRSSSTDKVDIEKEPYSESIGSTIVLDKDNEVRLVSTVEVTRPLSMSSIASSSSTSSSGVQTKGVNSAYLASIESLDDHSDADMTSAKGSNNFVNSTGKLNDDGERGETENIDGSGERCVLSQLERVCAEIVETENVYVEDLRQVVEGYLHVWRQNETFPQEDLAELFNNIEEIYAFNRSLCDGLNTCQLDPISLARQFVDNTSGFTIYTSYCTGYPQTMTRLAALASCAVGARECRERQARLQHALPLGSYLLKPVQRILKYHLLLQNLVKQCRSPETEYALRKMTGIAQYIDDMKRKHEHAVRVQEIQSLLYGWSGPDLTTYGELCAEGTFRVFGAKAMRHAFLFDKMLLLTKNREDGILAYKSHIMCNNLMLVESIEGAPLGFHVIPWDAPRAQLTLQARSQRHKREWTLLLKRVILENYNAVIPSHARQLVMELGQNKTDDDILAEKSRNLITHASMRKQLSAPEYLEKRKLERERRKTCENRLKPISQRVVKPACDCAQVSAEKGTDFTCDSCYIDLCSDCEAETKEKECSCKEGTEKCPECDKSLHFIDAGSTENLDRRPGSCKCPDFKSSQDSFGEYSGNLTNREYHSSDNIANYNKDSEAKNVSKTCLKCAKIKENIVITGNNTIHRRKSRCSDLEKKTDALRSKSKDDSQRSRLSKISPWRRKSEPGLDNGINIANVLSKKVNDSEKQAEVPRGNEKIEFECRNCGSNKITRKRGKNEKIWTDSDQGSVKAKFESESKLSPVEVRMYNTKHVPKKISKLRKSRAKGLRLGSDVTAKFYADFSTDISTENILHISESTDSINALTKDGKDDTIRTSEPKDYTDIDEETYKKLIEKTDSFKKNELDKVKYLNQQKVINEGTESESDKHSEPEKRHKPEESGEESEKPLEQIISQLLMQNREFQKILKKQQQRNGAHRRQQRFLKSHSNPEEATVIKNKDQYKIRPKYGRQTSETLKSSRSTNEEVPKLSPPLENTKNSEEEHIYETLRVDSKEAQKEINKTSKQICSTTNVNINRNIELTQDSDYVYLSFDKLKQPTDDDGIYDVPSSIPVKKQPVQTDYYVAVSKKSNDNIYDNVETRMKDKEHIKSTGEYLPMYKDQQNPNAPEIWLSRQKEHFHISRDRKSGSLPRSFQVVTPNQEDKELITFKGKPNLSNKTYLNRDGKVLSTDRPFTIASDRSEICYDDVSGYMKENDVLKYKRNETALDSEYLSKSTLDLEEEIDRCYKNNFENDNKNRNLLTESQQSFNVSINSSCEVLSPVNQTVDKPDLVHPEHKIYKPTTSFSIRNVLNRFKNKSPNKNSTHENDRETNSKEQTPDSVKIDPKSPTSNEKRSALNPRSYSKNLLQRFKSIIADEHPDDIQSKIVPIISAPLSAEELELTIPLASDPTVETSAGSNSTLLFTVSKTNDLLSKSVCETITERKDHHYLSCENIKQHESCRLTNDKIDSVASSNSTSSSPSKVKSDQHFNKLPIYKQGSKLLGARIAQSDYIDPQTLSLGESKNNSTNVNVLINKNSVRPDSLLSNSSFITSSSEGTYQKDHRCTFDKTTEKKDTSDIEIIKTTALVHTTADGSYYEKSFEKIENVVDEELFRDSAVYSDDGDSSKVDLTRNKSPHKTIPRLEKHKGNSSKTEFLTNVCKTEIKSCILPTNTFDNSISNQRTAPPVPVKPRLIAPTTNKSSLYKKNLTKSISNSKDSPMESLAKLSKESTNSNRPESKTSTESSNLQSVSRSESINSDSSSVKSSHVILKYQTVRSVDESSSSSKIIDDKPRTSVHNIQMQRLSFERTSLDSIRRKSKVSPSEENLINEDSPKCTSKSVLERRLEIESLEKGSLRSSHKTSTKPKQLVAPKPTIARGSYQRSSSEDSNKKQTFPNSLERSNIPKPGPSLAFRERNTLTCNNKFNENSETSWVKTIVNKFQ